MPETFGTGLVNCNSVISTNSPLPSSFEDVDCRLVAMLLGSFSELSNTVGPFAAGNNSVGPVANADAASAHPTAATPTTVTNDTLNSLISILVLLFTRRPTTTSQRESV